MKSFMRNNWMDFLFSRNNGNILGKVPNVRHSFTIYRHPQTVEVDIAQQKEKITTVVKFRQSLTQRQ